MCPPCLSKWVWSTGPKPRFRWYQGSVDWRLLFRFQQCWQRVDAGACHTAGLLRVDRRTLRWRFALPPNDFFQTSGRVKVRNVELESAAENSWLITEIAGLGATMSLLGPIGKNWFPICELLITLAGFWASMPLYTYVLIRSIRNGSLTSGLAGTLRP